MPLDGTYDINNVFARILRGELPAAKVYEDAEVLAFMDAFPQSEGHVLVISKTSTARNLLEVDAQTLSALMSVAQKVGAALRSTLKPDGLLLMQANGAAAGQTVYHLHFHIIPRWTDRPMKGHGKAEAADPTQLRDLARRIAAALPA
jgi:histidine triad (HIT) family protein